MTYRRSGGHCGFLFSRYGIWRICINIEIWKYKNNLLHIYVFGITKTSGYLTFCVVTLLFGMFCWCKGFCHMTESDLFLFLFREYLPSLKFLITVSLRSWKQILIAINPCAVFHLREVSQTMLNIAPTYSSVHIRHGCLRHSSNIHDLCVQKLGIVISVAHTVYMVPHSQ